MRFLVTILLLRPEPKNIRFGGGVLESSFNPYVMGLVVIAGILMCTGSRRRAIAAFLLPAIWIPYDQIVMLGPVHFPMLRVLILFGIVRMMRDKARVLTGGLNGIDIAVLCLGFFTTINALLLFQDSGALIFQVGSMLTAFGSYFLLRSLIRNQEDLMWTLRALAYAAIPIAGLMIFEQLTGRNPYYAALGGANGAQWAKVWLRDGHLRATGCFGQPILAGTFGGITTPLFIGWWWKEPKSRLIATIGIVAATTIAVAANSSTSLFAYLGGFVALPFWLLRRRMRILRWAVALMIVGLHLVMKAPVWHLISRVSLAQGSDSEHRYQLVNQCILHFSSWWMIGTKEYATWGWDMWDLGNQYVGIADQSGLIPLLCFLAIFVYGFKYLGRTRVRFAGYRRQQFLAWAFGSCLFANVVGFFGISYFDQTIVVWYAILAMIGTLYLQQPQRKAEAVRTIIENPAAEATQLTLARPPAQAIEDLQPRELRIYEI